MNWDDVFRVVGASLLSAASAGVVIFGLSSWLGKVWANRILERERLELQKELEAFRHKSDAALDRQKYALGKLTFVHQKQFEKEFEAYTKLWVEVVQVRTFSRLRPTLDYVDSTKEDVRKTRLEGLQEALLKCGSVVEVYRPFYHEGVYSLASELTKTAWTEGRDYQHGRDDNRYTDYYKKGDEAIAKIDGLTDRVCEEIRRRISSLEVRILDETE